MTMLRYIIIFVSTLLLVNCASVDEFLELPIGKGPTVIFKNHLTRSTNNSIVLIGIDNPEINTGLQYRTLEFYLHNTNKKLEILNINNSDTLNYLHFEILREDRLTKLVNNFEELIEMTVYAMYLENMSVNYAELGKYENLGNGSFRNVKGSHARKLRNRDIQIFNLELNPEQSGYYKSLITNIFSLTGSS